MLVSFIKRLVAGTPVEGLARTVYHSVYPPPPVDLNSLYDEQTLAVMERVLERDSNFVDVGCHKGHFLELALRLAPDGRHYAFEPLPDLYAALSEIYGARRGVHLYEAALSDTAGSTTFQHVVTNPGYSGLQPRRYDRPNEQVTQIRVNRLRLDDVIERDVLIRLIKIDVEGAEVQVLRGAVETLRRCRPYVVFEHGLGGADYYGTGPDDVFNLFESCGLHVSVMSDWLSSNGKKDLSHRRFADQFYKGRNYYFMAHP